MSLRTTFLLLLFANLAFLGWAALIDVPAEPAESGSISNLPQLKLLSEVRGTVSSSASASGAALGTPARSAPTATGGDAPATSKSTVKGSAGAAASAGSATASQGTASQGTASQGTASSVGTTAPAPRVAAASAELPTGASGRCVTIGPFGDPERAREAADVLRERGFKPRGRMAAVRQPQGYWVFVGGLKSSADETSVLDRLERNGISDAKAMPSSDSGSDSGHRVSVGLFNALDGAERRARAVRRLGLDAQVEPRSAQQAHWLDVDLASSSQSLPAEGLLSLEEPGSRLEIKECPAPEPLTAAGHPRLE
ncbi:MAG TPA: SPOR domain-containing protein [Steroidobacteraceae bacterium]|nr:SPOR domain-containing protein [Steroidobacteraceae bacterium]